MLTSSSTTRRQLWALDRNGSDAVWILVCLGFSFCAKGYYSFNSNSQSIILLLSHVSQVLVTSGWHKLMAFDRRKRLSHFTRLRALICKLFMWCSHELASGSTESFDSRSTITLLLNNVKVDRFTLEHERIHRIEFT